ncbi:MAG: hypothetical protein V3T08_09560 [Gemmatimonadota bacterium]
MSLLHDEKGKKSMGRILLALHTLQNWVWMWLFILGVVQPLDSDTLNLLIGSLDVTMFIVFGGWVIGPRSFQYLFPQLGALAAAGGALVGRLKGTDNRYEDDEQ